MVGKGGHDNLAILFFPHGSHFDGAVSGFIEFQQVFLRRDDFCIGREIGSLDVFTQLGNRGFGVVQQPDGGRDDFSEIMGRNVRGHTNGDAGAAIQ